MRFVNLAFLYLYAVILGVVFLTSKSPSYRKLTEAEKEFFYTWKGQCQVVESIEQVVNFHKFLLEGENK
jgi:hypothetical protein